ncbi:MAG: VWA domain-containing protein [bacterium]|nr:VWA domain-containing protein [bacterium]
MSRRLYLILPAALSLLLISVSSPTAQEGSVFVDRVDVNVVNVEAFVTDAKGEHVGGLAIEDFEILEDDEPVTVTNFYTVTRRKAPPAGSETIEAAQAAEEPVPPEQQLHLLVYVDNFNIRPGNRKRVLSSLEGFLESRTAAGDRIMLVTYDRGIRTVLPFTDDPEQVAAGLTKVRHSRANGMTEDLRRRVAARQIANALRDPMTAGSAQSFLTRYVDETRANLLHSTRALEAVVRSLAGLSGRKAMLYVSDGLPQRPGEQLADQFFGAVSLSNNESTLFRGVMREANAQQVTFYTLDARGSVGTFSTAEMDDDIAGGVNRTALDAARNMNFQEPLIDMAVPTGGTSFLNSYNFDVAMEAMSKDFDHFYSLGYQSRFSGDGRYHTIEVRVKRPDLSVRHRSGFFDKPEIERVADRTLAALITQTGQNPLGIRLEFEQPEKKKSGKFLLPTLIRIPLRELTLLPTGKTNQGRLRIFLVVRDAEGGVSPMQEFPYPLAIPNGQVEAARDSAVGHLTQLELRSGEQTIAVGILDENSGVQSFARRVIDVGG